MTNYEMDHPRENQGRSGSLPVADQALCRSRGRVRFSTARHRLVEDRQWHSVDVPNCELGHHGEDVSFDSILKKYNLTDPALLLLGEVVRTADSHPSNPHPAGEGLRWLAHGFTRLGLSDHEILEREFVVYDAL